MDLLSLVARLTLDSSQYEQGMQDAESSATGFAAKLKSGLGTAAKVGAAAIAAVGTAAAAATATLMNSAKEVAAYGDNIDKASQKLGISAEAYQEWDAVLQHSGTSIDSLGIGLKTLSAKAASGSDAFEKLGISQKKAASMSREELFNATITGLQNVKDENERAALATELFGRSAMELGPLLNTSAADTQAMKDRVHELGGVMSDAAVKNAAQFQDRLQDLNTAIDGIKRGVVTKFIPAISEIMEGITRLITGEENADRYIETGIIWLSRAFESAVNTIMDLFDKIMPALLKAIRKGLPTLVNGATRLVWTFGEAILEELPSLLRTGVQIIATIAKSIADNLPELIPTIVDVVVNIVDILTEPETLSVLVDAAIAIILALAEGLIEAMPKLVEKAPTIISNLAKALIDNGPKMLDAGVQLIIQLATGLANGMSFLYAPLADIVDLISGKLDLSDEAYQWGKDLINGFVRGIFGMLPSVDNAGNAIADAVRKKVHFSEPDEGPLSDFHTYAPDMMKLFAQGIKDNTGLVTDAVNSAFNFGPRVTANAGQEFTVPRATQAPQNMTLILSIDGREFGRVAVPYIEAEQRRVGVRLAEGSM